MLHVAVIADDLTGAADTGVLFLPVASEMRLLGVSAFAQKVRSGFAGGAAVNTDTRQMSLTRAVERVEQAALALKAAGAGLVYKKIDSCLRGHAGAELARLARTCGRAGALVVPAYPRFGRITRNNVHYVLDTPVAESEAGHDLVRPVLNSTLTGNLVLNHDAPVGHISLAVLEAGEQAVRERMKDLLAQGCLLLGADAACDRHLDLLAGAALKFFPELILSGSAGLASAVVRQLPPARLAPLQDYSLSGPVLFVGGSASRVLAGQLEHLAAHLGIDMRVLDADRVLAGLPEAEENALCRAVQGRDAIIRLSPPPAPSGKTLPSRELALALGALVARLLTRVRPSVLFSAGGDTTQAIVEALGNPELTIRCEKAPGLILSTLAYDPHTSLSVLTKSGGFGPPDLLTSVRARFAAGASV